MKRNFPLDGFVNKQNWGIWWSKSYGLSHYLLQKTHLVIFLTLAILCGFLAVQNVLEDPRNTLWFMQDGSDPHRKPKVFCFLKEHSDDRGTALDYCKHTWSNMDLPIPDNCRTDTVHIFCIWGHWGCNINTGSANFVIRLLSLVVAIEGYIENIVSSFYSLHGHIFIQFLRKSYLSAASVRNPRS